MMIFVCYIHTWTTVDIAGDICNIVTLTVITATAGTGIGARAALSYNASTTSSRAI